MTIDRFMERLSKAEEKVKELTEANAIQVITAVELDKQVQRLAEENERLEDNLIKQSTENIMLLMEIQEIKAKTVRKMKALIAKESSWFVTKSNGIVTSRTYQLTEDKLEQIAKEMLEE